MYWDLHTNEPRPFEATDLSGIFTIFIGSALDPEAQTTNFTPASYPIQLVDVLTSDVRANREVSVSAQGHVTVLVFPPTKRELAGAGRAGR